MKNLFFAFTLAFTSALVNQQTMAAEPEGSTYILLNVTTNGPLITRKLGFSGLRSKKEDTAQGLQNIGRCVTKYILDSVEPGKYYLSSIYPALNNRENGNRVDVDDKDGVITIVKNSINYTGDIYIESDKTSINVNEIIDFMYKPNSATLMAAATAQKELFQELDVVIT